MGFPASDLLRRRFQTSLTIATLTLSVAATLFLLLFSSRIGLGISQSTGTLTFGLSAILSQFVIFEGALIFVIGSILTSFIVFLMMAQRTRDFGLIKAAGCPNALVAGYFMTELLIITVAGCVLGVGFGLFADYTVANFMFSAYSLPSLLFPIVVFVAFFVLAFVFGVRPIFNAAKMSPIKALSPVNYYGVIAEKKHKALSKSALTWRIATRSLFRRQSATVRIIILLSTAFLLLTVSVAGGIIAGDTTSAWVEGTVGKDTLAVAHSSMGQQYKQLLTTFSGSQATGNFDYSDAKLAIPEAAVEQLRSFSSIGVVDERLVLKLHVQELTNFTISHETLTTYSVGDSREADLIVIGVDPQNLAGSWSVKGQFLGSNNDLEAVIGDSVANKMYMPDASKKIWFSDPLVQGMKIQNTTFRIVGVCVDPTSNGFVVYVPYGKLANITGEPNANIVLINLKNGVDRSSAITEITQKMHEVDADLQVYPLTSIVEGNLDFLSSTWSVIMLLPALTLASAAFCLVGYTILSVDEQHQEFAILRAIGTKPRIVVVILSIQSLIVLLSSAAAGISLGVITTLLILMANPLVTTFTVTFIAAWLLSTLTVMFLLSLYPAFKLAKTPILKIFT